MFLRVYGGSQKKKIAISGHSVIPLKLFVTLGLLGIMLKTITNCGWQGKAAYPYLYKIFTTIDKNYHKID
jgi:hypothetical protein